MREEAKGEFGANETLIGWYIYPSAISGQDGLFGLQVGPVFFETGFIACPPQLIDIN